MALRFKTGPSFDDRATGKFSGMPSRYEALPGPSFSDRATGKFSGSPRGYPTPSNRQPGFGIANTRVAQQAGLGDRIRNVAGNVRRGAANVGRGMMHPFAMAAGSIAANQAQHRYLDEVYGKDKGAALWGQAMRNRYDVPFDPDTENAAIQQFGQTGTGTSLGQAGKYFQRAGITQNDLDKFMDPNSKWYQNQAYLESAAGASGAKDFREGMTYIKNAKATANLARAAQAAGMENEMFGGRPLGGPSFDDAATRVRSYPEDTGLGDYSDPDEIFEDITADIAPGRYDVTTGYDRDPIYDFERQRQKALFRDAPQNRMNRSGRMFDQMSYPFAEEELAGDYTAGYPGIDVMNDMTRGETSLWRGRNQGTRGAAGSMDQLYMNQIGDVMNRGPVTATPNISVDFTGYDEDEDELFGPGSTNPRLPGG